MLRLPRRHLLALGASLAAPFAAAQPLELLVAVASSLADALREIGAGFAATQPGLSLRITTGASGALLQQLAAGAPIDVWVSADEATMDQAVARGLVLPSARRVIARNRLVLVVPASAAALPQTLADLASPRFARIAIGTPGSVPAGRYAQQALQAAGLWPALQPRLVGAANVRQVLDYVARREVDAGFVYATDAALQPGLVRLALAVPTAEPIVYPAAPSARAPRPEQAAAFVQHLLGDAAQAVLRRLGFGAP